MHRRWIIEPRSTPAVECKPTRTLFCYLKTIIGTIPPLLLGFVCFSVFPSSARADGPEVVEQIKSAPVGHIIWQITRPNVKQAKTDYPQITFAPGNRVTINATGCVQTGGAGLTWKRYVAPAGNNAATLYHGELWVPGAMSGLQFFSPVQPVTFDIPTSATLPSGQNHLILGYTDDGYEDNGYYKHDDGNSNQCAAVGGVAAVGDVVVTVDIQKSTPAAPVPPAEASYVVNIENVTIRRVRSRESDTDTMSAGVIVNGTQSATASQPVGDWKQGSHDTSFSIRVDEVEPTSRIAVGYTIVNSGNPDDQKIDDAVTGIIGGVAGSIPVVGSALKEAATIWAKVFPLLDPNCDGPVVAESIMGTGADFAEWTQNGLLRRIVLVPGVDSATGCGPNSYYEVTYSVEKALSVAPESFIALHINAKTHAVAVGKNVRLYTRR